MNKQKIIGIMGPGDGASKEDQELAFELGKGIAQKGYLVLTGGRASGVMEAAMKGAKEAGGTTIGILPSEDGREQSQYVDIPIKTGMGSARNNINVLTADVVVGIGTGPGTISEIVLAIKAEKSVILINQDPDDLAFFERLKYAKLHISSSLSDILERL